MQQRGQSANSEAHIFLRKMCRATWPVMSCVTMLVVWHRRLERRFEKPWLGSLGLMQDIHCTQGKDVTSRNTHITNADTLRPVMHPAAVSLRGEQLPTSTIHGSWIYPDPTLFPRIVKSPTSCYFPTLHFLLIVILLTNMPPPPHYPRHSFRIPISLT